MNTINQFNLIGKNVIITGASSGIGRQCAISCCQMGAKVILIGRREEKLRETIKLLSSNSNAYYTFDVTNFSDIESLVSDSVLKFGKIDGFVHSAGIDLMAPLNSMSPEKYLDLFNTNVIAGFEFARITAKKKYININGGSFIFIASIMGIVGNSSLTAYSATKGALISGTKSMALELAPKKIRVNTISPGHIQNTEMTNNLTDKLNSDSLDILKNSYPMGLGQVTDIANSCIFLLSDASSWITGSNLIIDGGYSAK